MSDKPIPTLPGNVLSKDQVQAVSGGDGSCTVVDATISAIQNLTTAYESLVDFTSHVIERIATSTVE